MGLFCDEFQGHTAVPQGWAWLCGSSERDLHGPSCLIFKALNSYETMNFGLLRGLFLSHIEQLRETFQGAGGKQGFDEGAYRQSHHIGIRA